MVTNRLKINDTKTEFPFVGSRQQLSKVQLELVTVEDSEISVRNLGAWSDGHSCEQSAVRPSAIHISSDRSESTYRKMLPGMGLARRTNSRTQTCNLKQLYLVPFQSAAFEIVILLLF